MSESKIQVKIGEFSFSGQGSETWLSEKLDQIMDKAEELVGLGIAIEKSKPQIAKQNQAVSSTDMSSAAEFANKALASFLKETSATANQNRKFLATAVWLQAKGKASMTTRDVTSALKAFNQQHNNLIEVRCAPRAKVHDRYIIHENGMLFLGPSLNNLGIKQGIIVELGAGIRANVLVSYNNYWKNASKVA